MTKRRSHGTTKWAGVRHYTTAQMKNRWTSTVYTTSGRVYGTGSSSATSPWYQDAIELYKGTGRTFYGK